MTDLEKAKALIALAEQTYIENYYGENIVLFNRSETSSGIDTSGEFIFFTKGE